MCDEREGTAAPPSFRPALRALPASEQSLVALQQELAVAGRSQASLLLWLKRTTDARSLPLAPSWKRYAMQLWVARATFCE